MYIKMTHLATIPWLTIVYKESFKTNTYNQRIKCSITQFKAAETGKKSSSNIYINWSHVYEDENQTSEESKLIILK